MGKGFQLIGGGIKALPRDLGDFGLPVAFYKFTGAVSGSKSAGYVKAVSAFIERELRPLLERYAEPGYRSVLCEKKYVAKTPVWFCWLSASEGMTDVARLCYERLLHMTPDTAEVHLLTMKTVSEYMDLPRLISDRYQSRAMNLKSLQDYIRAAVLSAYGGVWIDSSVFTVRELSAQLGRKVTLSESRTGGKIVLEYYSADDRERLIQNLMAMQ